LPNCLSPFIILVTAQLGGAILIEASLSFLGLGVPPPEPSWGAMLTGAARFYVYKAPWMAIFPGVAISLAVFGFNLFGDGLRDILDPRLRAERPKGSWWFFALKILFPSSWKNSPFLRRWSIIAEKVLEVKDLRTYFYTRDGQLRAVDGLSYHVNRGESVALVGESACGKSVSALSVMRLIPDPPGIIVGGEIIFNGCDLLRISEEEMHHIRGNKIAMVFQEPTTSLNPVLTVRRQLTESLELHKGMDSVSSAQEAIKLLQLVGIPDAVGRIKNYPYQFSGGMQQRIMIAMALSCNPALLIADEPTTSVDVTVQAQLLEIIDDLRSRFGTAVIIITHNLGVVARYVDRVNVMYAGRLVESGVTDVIFDHPMHPYTLGLLQSVPRLDLPRDRKLGVIQGLPPNLARVPSGCAFHPRCEFVMDRCRQERPPFEEVEENHFSACFRSREIDEIKRPETESE
jgi:oligopeptide transport system ATP-binding protein